MTRRGTCRISIAWRTDLLMKILNRSLSSLQPTRRLGARAVKRVYCGGWVEKRRCGQLDPREIEVLVSLVRSNHRVRELLEPSVSGMTREQQIDLLSNRATADMFVALKYLFASDNIDSIVLQEFARFSKRTSKRFTKSHLS